jgi:hypothetical protein
VEEEEEVVRAVLVAVGHGRREAAGSDPVPGREWMPALRECRAGATDGSLLGPDDSMLPKMGLLFLFHLLSDGLLHLLDSFFC